MKKFRSLIPGFLLTAIVLILVILSPSFFNDLDEWMLASWYRIRGEQPADSSLCVVYFGNEDINALGGMPIKRSYYALLIQALHDLHVAAVGIDIAFVEHEERTAEYDKTLAAVVRQAGNVVLSSYFRMVNEKRLDDEQVPPQVIYASPEGGEFFYGKDLQLPYRELLLSSAGCGHTNVIDRFQTPWFVKVKEGIVPSFFNEMLRVARQQTRDEVVLPTEAKGIVRPNFCGGTNSFQTMSALAFLRAFDSLKQGHRPATDLSRFSRKIVLVGIIAEGRSTTFEIPFSKNFPALLFQANLVDSALKNNWLKTLSWLQLVMIFFVGVVITLLVGLKPELYSVFISAAFLLFFWIAGYMMFAFLSLYAPISGGIILGIAIIVVQFIVHHQTIRNELADIVSRMQEKERHLQLLEQNAQREHSADEMLKLRAEIEKYQREITYLKSRSEDLQPYSLPSTSAVQAAEEFHGIVYYSNGKMAEIVEAIKKIADHDASVLILGESGTGKELVARALHDSSRRKAQPFVAVNCGALSETLLESELFGHEKGAFTGAVKEKFGRFELANNGTIFLDEIAETSEAFQVKLLRVLQEGTFERVGGTETKKVNVRIIAATNRNIKRAVEEKKLREDLYYRLNVFTLELPPLRERRDDIVLLAHHFVAQESATMAISTTVMNIFQNYEWRGNVRELQSVIKRAVVLAKAEGRTMLRVKDLPEDVVEMSFYARDIEQQVLECLREKKFSRSSITETAEELGGINRGTVAEYFRGFCFKTFVESGWNIEKTVDSIAGGNTDEETRSKVLKKLLEYLSNAVELVEERHSSDEALSVSKPKYKNLPQKYHKYLSAVITSYCEHKWTLNT